MSSGNAIEPISHLKLLNNQHKKSNAGGNLTDQYYCFSYENKKNTNYKGIFFCGLEVAEHFLKLTGKNPLPLFNPLKSILANTSSNKKIDSALERKQWNTTAKQLYNAIQFLLIVWETEPDYVLKIILGDLQKYYYQEPFPSKIKSVNTIIGKDKNGQSLIEMIDSLKANGNDIKDFDFSLLIQKLKDENIEKINF